jgi:hypothetical protein
MFTTFATSRLPEIPSSQKWNYVGEKCAGKFSLKIPDFHVVFRDLLHAVNLRHGTHSFTSLPKERRAEDIFALKNPTDSARVSNPRTLVLKAQDVTSRPPKPLRLKATYSTICGVSLVQCADKEACKTQCAVSCALLIALLYCKTRSK